MSRFRFLAVPALALSLTTAAGAVAQQPAPAPAAQAGPLKPADAAAFLGDWTLTMESPMGPAAIALSIKAESEKVVGEISSDMMPKTAITAIEKSGANLVLKYDFSYEGNAVPVVVTLTPGDKIGASMDFAGGAFQMNGTATKAAAK
jgi:hypothetical protein